MTVLRDIAPFADGPPKRPTMGLQSAQLMQGLAAALSFVRRQWHAGICSHTVFLQTLKKVSMEVYWSYRNLAEQHLAFPQHLEKNKKRLIWFRIA